MVVVQGSVIGTRSLEITPILGAAGSQSNPGGTYPFLILF